MSLRWFLWSLASPSQLLLLCLIVGSVFVVFGRLRVARPLLLAGGLGLLIFGLLPTAAYIANPLQTRFPQTDLPWQVTGIVLLSGGERPAISEAYGHPQVGIHGQRYVTTLMLAARFPQARIVYTGGARTEQGKGPLETQTAVARGILGTVGLDPARITYEENSTDTCDNASNTRALVQPKQDDTWVVVTSAIHMPRTIACFRAAGWPRVIPQPADYQSIVSGLDVDAGSFQVAKNLVLLDMAVHEWLGLAYYRLTGRTAELFPAP
jgi:uncharacterized SAM-binding protein YcdF (DUF218 family)